MDLNEKMSNIFQSGYSIIIQNEVRRKEGEWYSRITWRHVQLPGNTALKHCEWFGFENIEECVDDCLKYINSIS